MNIGQCENIPLTTPVRYVATYEIGAEEMQEDVFAPLFMYFYINS